MLLMWASLETMNMHVLHDDKFINSLWNKRWSIAPAPKRPYTAASLHFHSVGGILSYRLLEGRTA